jgi:hypothetical protein
MPQPGARQRTWAGASVSWSGGGGEGYGVAEGFELADVAAYLAVGVDGGDVVVGAEIVVARSAVGKKVPDDDQQGAGDGDQGLELAAAPDQSPVAFAEEGAGFAGRRGGIAEDALQVRVALGRAAGLGPVPGLDGARAEPGPGDQCSSVTGCAAPVLPGPFRRGPAGPAACSGGSLAGAGSWSPGRRSMPGRSTRARPPP